MATNNTNTNQHVIQRDETGTRSWAYILMGVLLVLGGIFVLGYTATTSFFSVYLLGWILVIGGIVQFFSIFFREGNRLGTALLGILYAIAGGFIIINPAVSLATLTLLIAILLTLGGLARAFSAGFDDTVKNRGMAIFGGILTFLLGVLIWAGWPESSLYVIGFFIGIELVIDGITMAVQPYTINAKSLVAA